MSVIVSSQTEEYKICKNLKHFCAFRGYEVLSADEVQKTISENMIKYEMLCQHGDKKVRVLYLPAKSKYNRPSELINILTADYTIIVKSESSKLALKKIRSEGEIEIIDGRLLLTNFAKYLQIYSCKLHIVPEDEVERIMQLYKIPAKKNFPHLATTSKEVIWLGAQLNDIVYLEYPTIASCEIAASYRVVAQEIEPPEELEEED